MSSIYFWSDMHLGDANVAEYRGHEDLHEHDDAILTAWAETIRTRDIVYFLGDLSIHNVRGALHQVSKLPGRKRIIWGNHDPAHPMFRDSHRWKPRFMEVFETGDSIGQIKLADTRLMLSHFPYQGEGDHTGHERYTQWRLPGPGLLLHGHVHTEWATRGHMFNVGVDHHPTPVHADQVSAWISTVTPF